MPGYPHGLVAEMDDPPAALADTFEALVETVPVPGVPNVPPVLPVKPHEEGVVVVLDPGFRQFGETHPVKEFSRSRSHDLPAEHLFSLRSRRVGHDFSALGMFGVRLLPRIGEERRLRENGRSRPQS